MLAKRYLQPAVKFGVRSLTLFAARGIGKTEFLKRDLMPLAYKFDLACVYCDVWETVDGPALAIARALEQWDKKNDGLGAATRLAERAKRLLSSSVSKAKAEIDLLGHKASIEASFSEPHAASIANDAERLLSAFEGFIKKVKKRPVMLIIDEAQALATPRFEPLIKTLRSVFQAHDEQIVRMFTGSSRAGLERMFRRSRAPLFGQGGTMDAFPALEQEFVEKIAEWFSQRTGGMDLNAKAAWKGFQRLHRSARLFRSAVESVLVGQARHIEEACELVRFDLLDDEGLKTKLSSLSALQRQILQTVWRQGSDLYAAQTLSQLTASAGERIDIAQVQSALKRLERMELIYRVGHGEYRIELPELELALEDLHARARKP